MPLQFLNGTDSAEQAYNKQLAAADKIRRNTIRYNLIETPEKIRRRQIAVQYYTNGLDNKTMRNIGYVTKGLDFVGYIGDGSIPDSEMIYNHLLRTKQIVDSAPQVVAIYQNPQQFSQMLGYVIEHWDSANREQALDNMANEESRLIDEGKIRLDYDNSDAHFLEEGEIYDPDTQRVLANGAVETLPNKRGFFNRLKKTTSYINVAQKDADIIDNNPLTRKLKSTIRQNVGSRRKPSFKNIKETRIKNGHIHTSKLKVPVITISIEALQGLSGLNGVDDDLQELLYGVDFAFNADEGLTEQDNIENYQRYFARLSAAIAVQPLAFFDSEAEANAVRQMLAQLIPAIGNDAAMDALIAKYESGISGFDGLGELNGKLLKKIKKAAKKAVKSVATSAKKVAKATVNATKQVAKTTANVTKAAAKATTSAVKTAAKATASAAKTVAKTTAKTTKAVAKAAVNTTKAAVKSTVNATKAAANVVKAGAQAATGNTAKAKATLKKATSQAKSAVTEPVKTTVKTTKNIVKTAVVQPTKEIAKTTAKVVKDTAKNVVVAPTKTVVKETKNVVKKAVIEPTKTIVKETIVKPTKAAIKLTKKVTKAAFKLTKKLLKVIWFYNPITLLIKGGLLVAFRLNMFKMASRSYLGSMTQEEAIKQYGITPEEWEAQKKSFDHIRKIFCKTFGGKESKLLAALKKGAKKKWSGTDNPASESEIKAAAESAEVDEEMIAELEADIAENKKELEAKGVVASNQATTTAESEKKQVIEDNKRTTKETTAMYEQGGESSKKIADLPKGTAVYLSTEKEDTDGTWIAVSTTDGKYTGYIKISALAAQVTPDGQPVSAISGLFDNYEQISGLGEAGTFAAAIAAAASTIAGICAKIFGFFKNVGGKAVDVIKNVGGKVADVYNNNKDLIDNAIQNISQNAENIESETPQDIYADIAQAGQQIRTTSPQSIKTAFSPASGDSGINKKLLIGGGIGLVSLGLIAFMISSRNNN